LGILLRSFEVFTHAWGRKPGGNVRPLDPPLGGLTVDHVSIDPLICIPDRYLAVRSMVSREWGQFFLPHSIRASSFQRAVYICIYCLHADARRTADIAYFSSRNENWTVNTKLLVVSVSGERGV